MRNDRLSPTVFHTRYIVLSQLRDETISQLKKINQTHQIETLVDFGCGDMPYRSVIEPMVDKYLGVDLKINPKAEHHIDFDSKTTLPDNFADVVLSNQVLEHVDNPSGYLQEAFRILKPSGYLVISTHGYWFYHPTPNDYWRWTSAGLRKTMEAEGFKINSFHGILGLAASGLQLFQDGIVLKLHKILIPIFALMMQFLIRLVNKLNSQEQRNRDGAVYVIVAQKL
ncbi:MAG: class I SAM-dependent methyltransferase [Sphingobacteriales bacterium]|nr:class I SAM-dependent methyltransferase [Sphingobacteriales bacterium]